MTRRLSPSRIMLDAAIASELEGIYKSPDGRATDGDIERWVRETGLDRTYFYDEIALYLAQGFHASSLTFEYCDAVANHIWTHMIHRGEPGEVSDFLFHVFCAFDEGEYSLRGEDPIAMYTLPILSHFLAWYDAGGQAYLKLRQDLYECTDLEERRRINERLSEVWRGAVLSLPRRR